MATADEILSRLRGAFPGLVFKSAHKTYSTRHDIRFACDCKRSGNLPNPHDRSLLIDTSAADPLAVFTSNAVKCPHITEPRGVEKPKERVLVPCSKHQNDHWDDARCWLCERDAHVANGYCGSATGSRAGSGFDFCGLANGHGGDHARSATPIIDRVFGKAREQVDLTKSAMHIIVAGGTCGDQTCTRCEPARRDIIGESIEAIVADNGHYSVSRTPLGDAWWAAANCKRCPSTYGRRFEFGMSSFEISARVAEFKNWFTSHDCGCWVDGVRVSDCFWILAATMGDHAPNKKAARATWDALTPAQQQAARSEWSRRLRLKVEQGKRRERNQVLVDLQDEP